MNTRFWLTTCGIVGFLFLTIGRPIMAQSEQTASTPEITTVSGLTYTDVVVGTGREAAAGNLVTVHYTGWLTNGKKFDSSVDRNEPFSFPIGSGKVIKISQMNAKREADEPLAWDDKVWVTFPANAGIVLTK